MTVRRFRHAQPYLAPMIGTVEERLSLLADAVNKKADANSSPVFVSIVLVSPNKTRWLVTVNDAGALTTEPIA